MEFSVSFLENHAEELKFTLLKLSFLQNTLLLERRSGVAEWLGCRTLNQRVVGSNPAKGKTWYL
jgi:hypothetical protein